MGFLDSEKLLDLLIRQGLIDDTQRRKIVLNKGKQRQKLLRMRRGSHRQQPPERGYPDMVNIVVSMNLEAVNKKEVILNEEVIIRAVAIELEIPFKKLEPLDLDMNIVTKTIPKSFAVNHLILPIGKKDNLLEVATYHPDKQSALTCPPAVTLKRFWRSFLASNTLFLLLRVNLTKILTRQPLISATLNSSFVFLPQKT
jgi:general secretion pathway protein E